MVNLSSLAPFAVLLAAAEGVAGCAEVVVGGGWGGVYTAFRLFEEGVEDVCLFERSGRLGGRTYSKPIDGTPFTLDLGAYRFSPDMHLPGDLILNRFDFATECYDPSCPDASTEFMDPFMFNYSSPLRRIVDPETRLPSGYVGPILRMAQLMEEHGVRVFLNTSLTDIVSVSDEAIVLEFGSITVKARHVTLNLPRHRLLELPSVPGLLGERTAAILRCIKFDEPPDLFPPTMSTEPTSALTKAYLLYDDAWWISMLNISREEYPDNAFEPVLTSSGIFVGFHFFDGPIAQAPSEDGKIQGFLEVYYAVTNETWWAAQLVDPNDPASIVWRPDGDEEDDGSISGMLNASHAAVLEALAPMFANATVDPGAVPVPSALATGVWSRPDADHPLGQGLTAPTKVYFAPEMSGDLASACGVSELDIPEYSATAAHPFKPSLGVTNVDMANNDWVAQNVYYMFGDWAEESLLQAERNLAMRGLPPPAWLDSAYYQATVLGRR